jgi:ATP-binding cassette subfamily B protein
MKMFKGRFLALFLCLLIWALNESLFPYFIKLMVEEVQATATPLSLWERFRLPILGAGGCWLAMELAMRIYGLIEVYLFPQFRAKMREDVFAWVKEHSIDYFTSNLAGSLGGKIADIPKSSQSIIVDFFWNILGVTFIFVASLVVVAQASLIFTALMVVWCAAHLSITLYYLKEIEQKTSTHYESLAKLNGETVDIISNAVYMKLFSREPYETRRLKIFQQDEVEKSITANWILQKVNFLRGFVSVCFIFTTIYLLLAGWQAGWVTVGDFPLVAMSSFNLMGSIWQMSMALLDMFRDMGTLNGALSLLREKHKVQDKADAVNLILHKGEIEFKNAVFGYRKNDPIFSGLCARIAPHEKVGLVGFSGSGKTTFVNLILRAYDLASGQVLIDGQDIATVTQSSLREQITLIPQEAGLFHRSIRENIAYGKLGASQDEIEEAARMAHCHDFILKLENGYETVVGERGLKLSGGQRQRLSIARAFLKNSPILLLDEATSALDSATEKEIQESLARLMVNKTVLVVAHRLSTLKHMSRIIVFHKGKIIEEGSQEKLMAYESHFAHLWSLQQEGFLPDKDVERGRAEKRA